MRWISPSSVGALLAAPAFQIQGRSELRWLSFSLAHALLSPLLFRASNHCAEGIDIELGDQRAELAWQQRLLGVRDHAVFFEKLHYLLHSHIKLPGVLLLGIEGNMKAFNSEAAFLQACHK